MKYDSRMGIAYDTIFYGVLYFNFDRLKGNYQKYPDISDEDFHLFYQLKEQISAPPPELYPFFYSDVLKPSFISNHFFYHFRFGQEDFAAFLARIETDSSFMQALIEYYLGQLDEAPTLENKKIVQKILQLDLDPLIIIQMLKCLADIEAIKHTLLSFLEKSFSAVKELHEQNKARIQKYSKVFQTDIFLKGLSSMGPFQCTESKKDRFSICLLNVIVILQKGTHETGRKFIFGYKTPHQIENKNAYFKISPIELCEALGNPIKSSILMQLQKKELTATQLSEILIFSRQTVNRHLLWLFCNWLIIISKRNGPEIYYKINPKFFAAAKKILYQYAESFEINCDDNKGEISDETVEKTNC